MGTARKATNAKKTRAAGKTASSRRTAPRKTGSRKTAEPKTASRKSASGRPRPQRKWSQRVTETSDALDLKEGVFQEADPEKIARSLKSSAEHSDRRKSDPYRSAMSMLTFYINRAGAKLPDRQRRHLEAAKDALRSLFRRPARPQR